MTVYLDTSRLQLRQWKESDLEPFYQLNSDEEVMRYFPDVLSKSRSDAVVARLSEMIDEKGWGFWAVEIKQTGEFIGFVGLLAQQKSAIPNSPLVEIGWRLAKSHWGKGYATEAAQASLKYAFETLSLSDVYSFTVLDNAPSRHVMSRIGMTNTEQDFDHPMLEDGHPLQRHCLYKITSEQWRSANKP